MFLARMDEGSAGFTMASIDLSEAVNKVAAPFKSVAVSGGKRLSTSIATGVRTHADAAAVAQVVELLLDNATRYASEGSVIELSLCAVSHGKGKGAIAEAHGGAATVSGHGNQITFTVCL